MYEIGATGSAISGIDATNTNSWSSALGNKRFHLLRLKTGTSGSNEVYYLHNGGPDSNGYMNYQSAYISLDGKWKIYDPTGTTQLYPSN
jgi:hypothetical protein